MTEFKKYTPRSIRFIELWNVEEWTIKIYSICETENEWDNKYINIAKSIAEKEIKKLPDHIHNHKKGFLTIHIAKQFNQVIFDWWARENELRHFVFKALPDHPESFTDITSTGEAFCVWELKVIEHERESWIKNVLENHLAPNFNAYYKDTLNCIV